MVIKLTVLHDTRTNSINYNSVERTADLQITRTHGIMLTVYNTQLNYKSVVGLLAEYILYTAIFISILPYGEYPSISKSSAEKSSIFFTSRLIFNIGKALGFLSTWIFKAST